MAKQTFTIGQVLTAAQMTSLQQTAMGGGSTTAKTASYTLVAADAGTVVQMNSASSTTITVNTALFSAGDSVQIQNIGAGVCTVTAGTATVSTAGSLALSQYEGGQLYFNTTSAALFFDIVQSSGMTNPLTTTGDTIYSSSGTTPARLGIGSTGQVLTVASGLPSWTTPASGGGMTLINTGGTALTGASVTVGSIPSTYQSLYISVVNFKPATNNSYLNVRMNGDSGANRHYYATTNVAQGSFNQTRCEISYGQNSGGTYANIIAQIPNYADGTIWKSLTAYSLEQDATTITNFDLYSWYGAYNQITAISSLDFLCNTGNFTSGTVYVYGVK